jgi:hypothetical protein
MTSLDFVTGDQGVVARILQDYAVEVIKACERAGHTMGSTWP